MWRWKVFYRTKLGVEDTFSGTGKFTSPGLAEKRAKRFCKQAAVTFIRVETWKAK